MEYKISVVLPVYNVEKYIAECLDSLLNQTFKNFEVIAINDGSTDKSKEIVESYIGKDINLKIINQNNGGLSKARNTGIKNSNGEYILFLDSDDMLDSTAIEKLYTKANKNKLDLVVFEPLRFEDETRRIDERVAERLNIYDKDIMDINEYLIGAKKKCLLMSTLHLYNSKLLKNNNLYFVDGILHEDELHSLTSYKYVKKVGYINEKLYLRRFRKDSIMTGNIYSNKKSLDSYIYILEELSKEKEKNNKELYDLIMLRSSLIISNLIRYNDVNLKMIIDLSKKIDIKLNIPRVILNILIFKILKKLRGIIK